MDNEHNYVNSHLNETQTPEIMNPNHERHKYVPTTSATKKPYTWKTTHEYISARERVKRREGDNNINNE